MRIIPIRVLTVLANSVCLAGNPDDAAYRTIAEKSDYRATARHAEVVELLDRLAADSPLARRTTLGKTTEGRDIPVLLIADPPVATPEEARKQVAAGKLFVFAIGNIHAGEVDGKEALPMVARELLFTPKHPLLRDLIVAFAPIYNGDGNEAVSKTNRPGQIGPDEGMGRRENGMGLDLNRDFIKIEAPETRGLIDFLNRWDPHIFIDTHTTNGSYHRYVITYEGPKSPAGDRRLVEFARDEFMPEITRRCMSRYQVPCFVYGDFNADHTRWETYPPFGRYGTTYVGLRGRLSVLSEGYSYASYKDRVLGTRDFVKTILETAAERKSSLLKMFGELDARVIEAGTNPGDGIALQTKPAEHPKKVSAAGFVEELRDGRSTSTGVAKDYEVELWTQFDPALTVKRPFAYVLPKNQQSTEVVVAKLREHGVRVERLAGDAEVATEAYRVTQLRFAENPFQGHKFARLSVEPREAARKIESGDYIVPLAQPLGNLIVYLLEPRSEDGLATWGFFEKSIKEGEDYPAIRVPQPVKFGFER